MTTTDTGLHASPKPMTLHRLRQMHALGQKITMLTCYDASFASLIDACGVDCILVGDSLGMVIQGQKSTLGVTIEDMIYHTKCVKQGNQNAWIVGDLPFGSYQQNPEQALASSVALMQAGAHMVKLEGGGWTADTVHFLTQRGIPVCAHLGLTPQSVHALGGYRIQGQDPAAIATLRQHATQLCQAGATMLVLELMPSHVANQVQADNPNLITIGIGAGKGTAGQVLVLHDMLNITQGKMPRFVRNFMAEGGSIKDAIQLFVSEVKSQQFPIDSIHGY